MSYLADEYRWSSDRETQSSRQSFHPAPEMFDMGRAAFYNLPGNYHEAI